MVGREEKAKGVRAQQRHFSYTKGLPGGQDQVCASQMVSITSRPQGVVPQPTGRSPVREGLSQKRSVGVDLFTRANLQEIHRRPIKFISAKIPACTEMYGGSTNRMRLREPRLLLAGNRLIQLPSRKHMLTLMKKKR